MSLPRSARLQAAGFLALAVAGLTSQDSQVVRAAYLTMELTGWFVMVSLCLASLLIGLVQSMGTREACSGTIGPW